MAVWRYKLSRNLEVNPRHSVLFKTPHRGVGTGQHAIARAFIVAEVADLGCMRCCHTQTPAAVGDTRLQLPHATATELW